MADWRFARADEDDAITSMCLALYEEDPSPEPVTEEQVRRTLRAFRDEPVRGCAVVLQIDERIAGYAILVSFWSNELGGEICTIDELYVAPSFRNRGHASELIRSLSSGAGPWPRLPVALELEITPANVAAGRLYERLGFIEKRNATWKLPIGPHLRSPRCGRTDRG